MVFADIIAISANLKYVKDPVCKELVAAITRDEIKHLMFGQKLLKGLKQMPASEAQSWVKACVMAMKQSSAPTEAYNIAFPVGTDTRPFANHALKSNSMSKQARHVATQLLRAWRNIPYLVPLASELSQIMQSNYSESILNSLEI